MHRHTHNNQLKAKNIFQHSAKQPHKDRIISKYTESVDRCVYDTLSVLLLSNHLISRQTIVLSLSLYSLVISGVTSHRSASTAVNFVLCCFFSRSSEFLFLIRRLIALLVLFSPFLSFYLSLASFYLLLGVRTRARACCTFDFIRTFRFLKFRVFFFRCVVYCFNSNNYLKTKLSVKRQRRPRRRARKKLIIFKLFCFRSVQSFKFFCK